MAAEKRTSHAVLLLAAHSNDEFALAATLRAHVLSGDTVWVAWFARDDREPVQQRRTAEAVEACGRIGIPEEHLIFADLPPLPLVMQVAETVDAVRDAVARSGADTAYVPAFEGGHPDHDVLNFAAWEGAALEGVSVHEFPIYHKAKGRRFLRRIPAFARMLPGAEPELRWLEPAEVEFKHELWKVYRTQRPLFDVLLRVSGDEHRFFATEQSRTLPLRDYTKPPHELPLLYEEQTDGMFRFYEFAEAVRRYHWGGGVSDSWAI